MHAGQHRLARFPALTDPPLAHLYHQHEVALLKDPETAFIDLLTPQLQRRIDLVHDVFHHVSGDLRTQGLQLRVNFHRPVFVGWLIVRRNRQVVQNTLYFAVQMLSQLALPLG